ncbi:hypothetical protein GCM10009753_33590 [Streptantibioticus ferralitis]
MPPPTSPEARATAATSATERRERRGAGPPGSATGCDGWYGGGGGYAPSKALPALCCEPLLKWVLSVMAMTFGADHESRLSAS